MKNEDSPSPTIFSTSVTLYDADSGSRDSSDNGSEESSGDSSENISDDDGSDDTEDEPAYTSDSSDLAMDYDLGVPVKFTKMCSSPISSYY